ncbi:alpha/beta fold hydrolase [Planococcus halotolerans]|uniref:alpha/beta fold hydrolase n=1 Tax=Planococcus halotolerans TaxID=2233542 RepID=UPI001093032E|nr:alpha/beta hydrolase [Planococcus halotolerans]QHJ72352.1 alpha/beta fold hydrolase [Planococcus halotolerans]
MKRYFITVEDLAVRVTEWGSIDAPVIFCLHGLGSTSLSFVEIAEALKGDFRVIAIDAPGHGKTEAFLITEQYELRALAKWVDKIIDILHIDHFYFLSHSWGSFVSLFYFAEFPQKVAGGIFIDGGYQSKKLKGQSMEEEMAFYEQDFESYTETWESFLADAVYGEDSRRSGLLDLAAKDLVMEKDNRFYWHARGTVAGSIVKGMHKNEITDVYFKLPFKLLLLRAELPKEQEAYRDKASRLFQQKTGATIKVIADTTHMLHWDKPQAVIDEIKSRWLVKTTD